MTYKKLNGTVRNINEKGLTVVLKNGIMFRYLTPSSPGTKTKYRDFLVDVNGNDKPNIVGRDLFQFYIDSKGHIPNYPFNAPDYNYSDKVKNCKTSSSIFYCFSALVDNNWKMDY